LKFEFSPDDEAFRLEVREFLRASVPTDIAEEIRRWTNPTVASFRAGRRSSRKKAGVHRIGRSNGVGPGGAPSVNISSWKELYRADAPDFFWQGLHMLAPVLIAFGSQEQKQRFLPRI